MISCGELLCEDGDFIIGSNDSLLFLENFRTGEEVPLIDTSLDGYWKPALAMASSKFLNGESSNSSSTLILDGADELIELSLLSFFSLILAWPIPVIYLPLIFERFSSKRGLNEVRCFMA